MNEIIAIANRECNSIITKAHEAGFGRAMATMIEDPDGRRIFHEACILKAIAQNESFHDWMFQNLMRRANS